MVQADDDIWLVVHYIQLIFSFITHCVYYQNNLGHKKWRKKAFPLYDEIFPLVDNRHATGSSIFYQPDQVALDQSPELEGDNDNDIGGGATALDQSGDDLGDKEWPEV